MLNPERFYDPRTNHVINLPENYFGVAARIASADYQLGIATDRAFVDKLLDRAAIQFTSGAIYSDDALPTGRYDRYSNEYAHSRKTTALAEATDAFVVGLGLGRRLRLQLGT